MIIYGDQIALKIREDLKKKLCKENIRPFLAVILVGDNKASLSYVKAKKKACLETGIDFKLLEFEKDTTQKTILETIDELNNDKKVNGILVQLPLPKHLDSQEIIERIQPDKDVDGLTTINSGKLFKGLEGFFPCTPLGVIEIFKSINYDLVGKNVVMIGRSNLVGLPLFKMLVKQDATVTLAHSKTKNLKDICKKQDVVIVAIGNPKYITKDYIKKDAVVIDVGINRVGDKLYGDVDFEQIKDIASYITPVPKGVGPLTIAMLLCNTYKAYRVQNHD